MDYYPCSTDGLSSYDFSFITTKNLKLNFIWFLIVLKRVFFVFPQKKIVSNRRFLVFRREIFAFIRSRINDSAPYEDKYAPYDDKFAPYEDKTAPYEDKNVPYEDKNDNWVKF